jgi:hypothetical protein
VHVAFIEASSGCVTWKEQKNMKKQGEYRSLQEPRYFVLDDPGIVSEMLLRRRFNNFRAAQVNTTQKVRVQGLGLVVMKKERVPSGRTRIVITVDGNKVDRHVFAKKIRSGALRQLYGVTHGKERRKAIAK